MNNEQSLSTGAYQPEDITKECIYAIFRDENEDKLSCGYVPLEARTQELTVIRYLAQQILDRESEISKHLLRDLTSIYQDELSMVRALRFYADDAEGSARRLNVALGLFREDMLSLKGLIQKESPKAPRVFLYPLRTGENQRYRRKETEKFSMASLFESPYEPQPIEIFSKEDIDASLETEEASKALLIQGRLTKAKRAIDDAKKNYRKAFEAYCANIEEAMPGITSPKSYCTEFDQIYTGLDYELQPLNVQILDQVYHYWQAQRLEEKAEMLSNRPDVIGLSDRWHGFTEVDIELDQETHLRATLSTNFGYGAARYFRCLISFMGVNLLDESLIVFYSGLNVTEYARTTHCYVAAEESFKDCFDKAVAYRNDLVMLGVDGFIERYVKRSIEELANLMYVISRSSVFLDITSLSCFADLVSRDHSLIMPGVDLPEDYFKLHVKAKEDIERFSKSVIIEQQGSERSIQDADWETFDRLKAFLAINKADDVGRQVAQLDYARLHLTDALRSRFGDGKWIISFVNEQFPLPNDYKLRCLEGYELVAFRMKKAKIVAVLLSNIQKMCQIGQCENLLDSLVGSCKLIEEQGKDEIKALSLRMEQLQQERAALADSVKVFERMNEADLSEDQRSRIQALRSDETSLQIRIRDEERRIRQLSSSLDEVSRAIESIR